MKKIILITMILALAACGGKPRFYLDCEDYACCVKTHYNQIPNLIADEQTGEPRNPRILSQIQKNVHDVCIVSHGD